MHAQIMGSDYSGSLTIVSKQLLIPRGAVLRVMELWNHLVWKMPSESPSEIIKFTYQVLSLNPVPQCHVHRCLKCLQGWGLQLSTRQPVPVLDHTPYKEFLPDLPPGPHLAQLEAI